MSLPMRGAAVPAGPDWMHEIKHDGYRMIIKCDGKRVRLLTRNGHDWTDLPVAAKARMNGTGYRSLVSMGRFG
jgi:ATP-dependent DNA ligase